MVDSGDTPIIFPEFYVEQKTILIILERFILINVYVIGATMECTICFEYSHTISLYVRLIQQ